MVGHLVRNRTKQEPLGARHALVAHYDQVRALLFGDVEDRVRGIALAWVHVDSDPGLARQSSRRLECGVDILAWAYGPLQVLRHIATLLAQALGRHRLVCAHELERRSHGLGEVDRLTHGLAGGV